LDTSSLLGMCRSGKGESSGGLAPTHIQSAAATFLMIFLFLLPIYPELQHPDFLPVSTHLSQGPVHVVPSC
jgi:hypothetical protein